MLNRGLILGGALVLFSSVFVSNTFADDNVDFSITVQNASLQLTVPPTASLDLTPTSANADFKSTNLTISVGTNNATGYTLTMSVPSTDISRTGAASGDPVIGTLGSQSGGYSQNDFTVNKWGYKITGDNYFPITTTLSPSQWVTDGPANNVDNTITLASKVNTAIPAGTYNTTLTFNAVANPGLDTSVFNIIYNPNGGTGTMSPTTITYGQTGTIAPSTFTAPTGYEFDGWASSAAGAGPYYDAGKPFTAPADATGGTYKVLYATWKQPNTPAPTDPCDASVDCDSTSGTTLQRAYELAYTAAHKGMYEETTAGSNTYTYIDSWNGGHYQGEGRDVRFLIQDMTPEICASATAINSEALVLDIRDQTSYHIIKGADGRCWLEDNLALDLTNVSLSTLSGNTNASDNTLAYLKGTSTGTTSDKYATSSVAIWDAQALSFSVPLIKTAFINTIPGGVLRGNGYHKVGMYYNICAASAGSYCYGDGGSYGTSVGDIEEDICPTGWRMPTGNDTSSEYKTLYDLLDDTGGDVRDYHFKRTLSLALTGWAWGGGANSQWKQGEEGYFWSATRSSDQDIWDVHIWGAFTSFEGSNRGTVQAVRCINKQ